MIADLSEYSAAIVGQILLKLVLRNEASVTGRKKEGRLFDMNRCNEFRDVLRGEVLPFDSQLVCVMHEDCPRHKAFLGESAGTHLRKRSSGFRLVPEVQRHGVIFEVKDRVADF